MAKTQTPTAPMPKYDIIQGRWKATKAIRNPFKNEMQAIAWKFERQGDPVKTGIPMPDDKVKEFNSSRLLVDGGITQQLVPTGSDVVLEHSIPNPFEVTEI